MLKGIEQKMKDISIRGKLKVAIGCIAVALIFVSVLGSVAIFSLKSGANDYEEIAHANEAISTCRINLNVIARNLREMIVFTDAGNVAGYTSEIEEYKRSTQEQFVILEQMDFIDQNALKSYEEGIEEWYGIGQQIVDAVSAGNAAKAADIIDKQCNAKLGELVLLVDGVHDEIVAEMAKEEKLINTIYILSMINNAVFLVAGLLVAWFMTGKLIQDIFVPMLEIQNATKSMDEGNLNFEMNITSKDEMGTMAHNLRIAADTLHGYIKDISRAMAAFSEGHFDVMPEMEWIGDFEEIYYSVYNFEKNMAGIFKEIYIVAEQVDRSAAQVADSASSLAQGATDQAAIIEELAATLETVSGEVSNNAANAKAISKEVENVGIEIISSNSKMQEMVQSMQEIDESSKKISTMIAAINDIASQTNLLALNASIEAARAGEAGRGFAVVADQVSVLAAQSAEAAKESTELIKSSVSAVEKGMVIAGETAKQLERVVGSSKTITDEVTNVATVLDQQAQSFNQINKGVEHINDVVQNNSAVSQECAAASEEMNAQANSLEQLIRSFRVVDIDE